MRLEIDGIKYEIRFRHDVVGGVGSQDMTQCLILREGNVVKRGMAVRHPNDRPNRIIGRKVALTDAIADYPRLRHRKIWDAFFEASPRHKRSAGVRS